jgi:hypothetical protein
MSSGHAFEGCGGGVGPWQQLVEAAVGVSVDDLGDGLGEIGVRFDIGELAGLDQRGDHSPMLGTSVGTGEQSILTIEGNLAAIVPISGRMSSSIIAGIHCTGEARIVFRVSGAHQARSCTWSCRPAL